MFLKNVGYSTHSWFVASLLQSSLISIQAGQFHTLIPFQKLTLWLERISTGLNWPEPLPELLSCNITCPCKLINWERPLDWSLVVVYLWFVWLNVIVLALSAGGDFLIHLFCAIRLIPTSSYCFVPPVGSYHGLSILFFLSCYSIRSSLRSSFNVLFGNTAVVTKHEEMKVVHKPVGEDLVGEAGTGSWVAINCYFDCKGKLVHFNFNQAFYDSKEMRMQLMEKGPEMMPHLLLHVHVIQRQATSMQCGIWMRTPISTTDVFKCTWLCFWVGDVFWIRQLRFLDLRL